jgi:hypothetical protein
MWIQAVTILIENERYVYLQVHVYIRTFQPAEVDQGKDGQTNPSEDREQAYNGSQDILLPEIIK